MNALPAKLIPLGPRSVTSLDIISISGNTMKGTIDFIDKGMRVKSVWEARRLPDDVPF
jgi:hypothetical protein